MISTEKKTLRTANTPPPPKRTPKNQTNKRPQKTEILLASVSDTHTESCTELQVADSCSSGRRSWGNPRTPWGEDISQLAWECISVPLDKWEEVAGWGVGGLGFSAQANSRISVRKWLGGWMANPQELFFFLLSKSAKQNIKAQLRR